MVSGKYKKIFWRIRIDEINVLGNGISSSTVNIQIGIRFLTWWKYKNTAIFCVKSPSAACSYVAVQQNGFVLCQNTDNIDSAVCTVTEGKINDTVLPTI